MKTQPPTPTATPDASPFAGHTPGPWSTDGRFHAVNFCHDVFTSCGKIEVRTDNSIADARLIAAAPDLLAEVVSLQAMNAALKAESARLRAALEEVVEDADKTGGRIRTIHRVTVDHARAALGQGVQS